MHLAIKSSLNKQLQIFKQKTQDCFLLTNKEVPSLHRT